MAINPLSRPDTSGFLPKEYVERRSEAKFYIVVFLLFIVVMAGVAGAFVVTQRRWSDVRAAQLNINSVFEGEQVKLTQLRQLELHRADMLERAKVTSALLEPIPRSVMMAELVDRLPGDVTLFTLALEAERIREAPAAPQSGKKAKPKTGTLSGGAPAAEKPAIVVPKYKYLLTIDGVGTANKQVADYLESLQESPLFAHVELTLIETKVIHDESYRGFRLTAELRDDADARAVNEAEEVEREVLTHVIDGEG